MELLLASRNPFYREGIAVIIQRIFDGCNVYQASTFTRLEDQLNRNSADLILIDKGISRSKSWEDILIGMNQTRPEIPICMLADSTSSKAQIRTAFELGVKGYLHSNSSTDEIKKTISKALAGRVAFPDSIWDSEQKEDSRSGLLTVRQVEIMKYVEKGKSNKAIANSLGLTEATIKKHISNIFKVLNTSNRVEAINVFDKLSEPAFRL